MTMRRILLLLALTLVPLTADAKVAIIVERNKKETQVPAAYLSQTGDYQDWTSWTFTHVVGFLNRYGRRPGVDYDIYSAEQVKTSLAASGSIQGKTYTSVIWAGVAGEANATNPTPGCWPCSLTLVALAPSVPQLFIGDGALENMLAPSTSCSLMVQATLDPNSQGPGFSDASIFLVGTNYKWHRAWDLGQMQPILAPMGGWRTIVGIKEAPGFHDRDSTQNVSFTLDKYIMSSSAHFDTATCIAWQVGARLNTHKSGMAQTIFCHWGTAAQTRMGGPSTDSNGANMNGDPFSIYIALAYLDSLTNKGVLGTTNPEPVRFAVQVEGLAARSSATTDGGLAPHDTTICYASLDSLDVLDFPLVFGVNQDSAGTYQRDINLAKLLGKARFTPWIRTGIDTAVAGGGMASYLQTRDLMGRYRNRTKFLTPFDTVTADTSIRNLAQWARWRIDSTFGGGRFSGVIMAPADDWSPKNFINGQGDVDSLVAGLAAAGYSGISFNVEGDTINVTVPTNPVGLNIPPHFSNNIYGSRSPFGFIAYTRLDNVGSLQPWIVGSAEGDHNHIGHNIRKLWMSAYTGTWFIPEKEMFTRTGRSQDWAEQTSPINITANISPLAKYNSPVNILRVSMAGLGSGATGTGAPGRPAWWGIKSLVNEVRALNSIAGRTLAQIVYPDDLAPTDLK